METDVDDGYTEKVCIKCGNKDNKATKTIILTVVQKRDCAKALVGSNSVPVPAGSIDYKAFPQTCKLSFLLAAPVPAIGTAKWSGTALKSKVIATVNDCYDYCKGIEGGDYAS